MRAIDRLVTLQTREIADARAEGAEFFMELPDSWYEPRPTYGCENGHVSHAYLKSEGRGNLCLSCHCQIALLPGHYTDTTLAAALAGIAQEGEKP